MTDLSQYTLPNSTGLCSLDCTAAFKNLTDKEKKYAHYLSQASWYGGLIVLVQTSPESPAIFVLLQRVFKSQPVTELQRIATEAGVTDEEFQAFLIYASAFYTNSGNYKSFGDSKIIPNLSKEKFETILFGSAAAKADPNGIKELWNAVSDRMFSLEDRQKELGLGEKGTTTYFSSNCDTQDADICQEFLIANNLSAYNTRLFKSRDSSKVEYEVRLASVESKGGEIPGYAANIIGSHQFTPKGWSQSATFNVTRGDYSKLMALLVENLEKAKPYTANENEVKMLDEYIKSFRTGSIPAHKDGSRFWIKNKGPVVETYIGFIESYRDPCGQRGEFEGFVAVVNKEMSAKFAKLVDSAEHLLALLPWPSSYEKDKFLRPDFTSLDVLTFGGSGIPAGINIPNYDEIRQDEGFKNVSLGNVLLSGYKDTKITFLAEKDKELYAKLKIDSFEVQVGLHELLGHGSGKLFIKDENGKFNFDNENVKHTETNEKVRVAVGTTETIKRGIRRQKAGLTPMNPKHLIDIPVPFPDTYRTNLIYDNESADNRILVFATDDGLGLLESATMWFMDGTHSTAPHVFEQVFTVRVPLGETSGTAAYALLPSMEQPVYEECLTGILDACLARNIRPMPTTVVCDYEIAIHNAVRQVLANDIQIQINSWYEKSETWDSKFSSIAPTYEECRAECVGLYLCLSTDALRIFGHEEEDGDDIVYINWLNMVRAGLMALEFYSPETRAWRQAHMNARFVILRVLLEAGEDLVKVQKITGEDGQPDVVVSLDRSKIIPIGKPAIGKFLRKLQVYKSTGDVKAGREMYEYYSDVHDSEEPHFLSLREIVLARKQPRRMHVQHNTALQEDGSIALLTYEGSAEGCVKSQVDRYQGADVESILLDLWKKDKPYF